MLLRCNLKKNSEIHTPLSNYFFNFDVDIIYRNFRLLLSINLKENVFKKQGVVDIFFNLNSIPILMPRKNGCVIAKYPSS